MQKIHISARAECGGDVSSGEHRPQTMLYTSERALDDAHDQDIDCEKCFYGFSRGQRYP